MTNTALVVGASGIVGSATTQLLLDNGWSVAALSRHPARADGIIPVAADLQDPESLRQALADVKPTHVFLTTWSRQATEAENIRVNAAMVRNVLDALRPGGSVKHVALVTGLKHYLGPFEAYGKGSLPQTPFREEQGRLDVENFYYAQEDEVFAAAEKDGFTWSVHRPHTITGVAVGNAMNMATTLAVYASICKHTGRPFVFPGSRVQWDSLTDMTDARQLAQQLLWAATTSAAANQAFNITNGDVFRWKWMWGQIAEYFGLEAADYPATPSPLAEQMADDAPLWRQIAAESDLEEADIDRLISPWHTDADLGRPIEVVTDMSKSRLMGFTAFQASDRAFFNVFDELRRRRLIP
ncbi:MULTISPECIES: SDR family oxidoreductase [unclassified Pseudomonas]|uniref:SDR family oxidoreductase n=1 Tax=unclassified Pseudomonas TaxID=196821 RepID=UPI000D3C581C|nr:MULTISPECIES: SDR family oxidoreductase [unclassified Pseudomonas]RAU40798.1 NAD-dependent dehydratase [Pseudomonas sp. RIT 409]RAU48180.1 NAD-dependent dehydratase [Pseudomonas sp. RIT 412]